MPGLTRIGRLFPLVVAGMVLLPVHGHAEVAPSFDCGGALKADEQAICDDLFLLPWLDVQLTRLWQDAREQVEAGFAKADRQQERQRAWLKERRNCRSSYDCLATIYMARIQALTLDDHQQHDPTGFYRYEASPEDRRDFEIVDAGTLALVRQPDDRLAGIIETVTGPSYHLCNVDFGGAERIGEHYLWRSADPDFEGGFCRLLIQFSGDQEVRIDSLDCQMYCGARGSLDRTFERATPFSRAGAASE